MVSLLSLYMGISMIVEPLAYDTLESKLAVSPLPISNGTPTHRDHSILESFSAKKALTSSLIPLSNRPRLSTLSPSRLLALDSAT